MIGKSRRKGTPVRTETKDGGLDTERQFKKNRKIVGVGMVPSPGLVNEHKKKKKNPKKKNKKKKQKKKKKNQKTQT